VIVGFFMLDRDRKVHTSTALWIPVIWMLFAASKPLSQWLQVSPGRTIEENLEGNPLERSIFTFLLVIGVVVLVGRGQKALAVLRMNGPILLFFAYCAVSTLWSDYADLALKRWIKSLGDLVMIMIILTDPAQSSAVKRFLARMSFLLVPVSVLLIKYYPDLGLRFDSWNGRQAFIGVTNDKNMLGVICLIFGLGAVWRILHALRERQHLRSNRPLIAHGVILVMVLWLFWKADSMTSFACFVLAGGLLVATSFPALARKRAVVHLLVVAVLSVASFALFFDGGGGMVKTLGRDPTLTGRTELWRDILGMNGNPLIGTGFESFWLGPRLEKLWTNYWWQPNEAHNGYLEVFLNLGWVGVMLLGVVIAMGYRNVTGSLRREPELGQLKLAYFVVGITYSFTEAGFRLLNPVWICFMLGAIAIPKSLLRTRSVRRNSAGETVMPEWRPAEEVQACRVDEAAEPRDLLSTFYGSKPA
jgi:exopolysaccharide production protein ExoQ